MAPPTDFIIPAKKPLLFGVDVDGTFYTPNKESMHLNIQGLAKARKSGYNIFFCTGRPLFETMKYMGADFGEITGYNGFPGVYQGGCTVYDEKGELVHLESFSVEFLRNFLDFVFANKLHDSVVFFELDGSLVLAENCAPIKEAYAKSHMYLNPKLVSVDDILRSKIPHIGLTPDVDVTNIPNVSVTSDFLFKQFGMLSSIVPAGTSKAKGVLKLCEYYNVDPVDVAFIGDAVNDIEIMEMSKISFAVGNASDDIKQHAKFVLQETCHEAAVAKAFQLLYNL